MTGTGPATLLIPSAVLVPDELKLELGPIPTGMIPLHGKPAIEHIADSYEASDDCPPTRKVIACGEQSQQIVEWTERSEYDWEVVDVGSTRTLGATVGQTLDTLGEDRLRGSLFVHFADTLVYPACAPAGEDSICYETVDHPLRWTTFETGPDGRVSSISEKFTVEGRKRTNTFVGQFQLQDPVGYHEELTRALGGDTAASGGLDPFYAALLSYLDAGSYTLRQPDNWIDVGHLDTYYRAKTQFLNTREFNEMRIDEQRNIIRKESDDPDILGPEIRWYDRLPKELKPFTPQVFDYSLGQPTTVDLEYVGYPTLSDIYLYGDHGIHIWKGIFRSLFETLDAFAEHSADDHSGMADAQRAIYYDKTVNRLERLADDERFEPFFDRSTVTINGTEYEGLDATLSSLRSDLDALGLLDPVTPTVIHGDLCFANILYDVRTSLLKLIDPRGSFGTYDVYGDPRYDLAKLLHSVDGNYEFIINDRFDVTADPQAGRIEYTKYTDQTHDQRRDLFLSMLESHYPEEIERLWGIESLLWLSMVPLHADEPERQFTMLAQGIEKYNRVFGEIT